MHVTVGICTRNRGERIGRTVASILASDYQDFDVIVADQSVTDEAADAVRQAAGCDSRVTCIRTASVGKSLALNTVIKNARGPVVAFTDDDCDVSPGWLHSLVSHFTRDPQAGEICGAVLAGPHDARNGYIPDAPIRATTRITSPWARWRERGIGANVAFRLDALQAVGPYDTVLGPGGPLYTGEDFDMTYRMLKAGYAVLDVPDAYVVHHGFRTWEEGRSHMRRTGLAVGAVYMKHLRMGDVAVLPTFVYELVSCISWTRLLTLQPRNGLGRFAGFLTGCLVSFRYQVDRRCRVYRIGLHDGADEPQKTGSDPGKQPK